MPAGSGTGVAAWATETVTRAFLFTDIESSTRRWEGDASSMAADLARHDDLLRTAVERHRGRIVAHTGDGMCADFDTAAAALHAALESQRALGAAEWQGSRPLAVRMAVHVGAVQPRNDNFFGPTLNRTARLMSIGAGGQILCSAVAAEIAAEALPPGAHLQDLGEHRLADLSRPERVFQLVHPDLRADFPPLRSAAEIRHNLPARLESFLGRSTELDELVSWLRSERLITLWGPGGAGKTSLSLELAARVLPEFPDGVWFVELAPLDKPDLVVPTMMSALGMLAGPGDALDDLCRYLTNRQVLLVLDNCEHLVDAVAAIASAVLARCPGTRMVTSSREVLAVPGERAWSIPPLSLPSGSDGASLAASDAVALFCRRAATAAPGFVLEAANSEAVAEVCRRLDGIPLALELAAARVRSLGVAGVAARLDDRFGLLTGRGRGVDARHQTLRAAMDWSYELLDGDERSVLGALSVFPGTFDLEAVQSVAGGDAPDAVDVLARLIDKSLVGTVTDTSGGLRYRLLETIRSYAAERLASDGRTASMRRRHLQHYLTRPWMDLEDVYAWDIDWMTDAAREHDNLRVALEWAIGHGEAEAAARLVGKLCWYWLWADVPGAAGWLTAFLAMPNVPREPGTAFALAGLPGYTGDPAQSRSALEMAESLDDDRTMAIVCFLASEVGNAVGDADLAARIEDSLRLCESADLRFWASWGRHTRAWAALRAGDAAGAAEEAQRALKIVPDPAPEVRAHLLGPLAIATALTGDAERADALAEEILASVRYSALASARAMGLARAVAAATLSGRWNVAERRARDLLVLLHSLGTDRWVGDALELAVLILEATGRRHGAAQILRAVDAMRSRAAAGGGVRAVADALDSCRRRLVPDGAGPTPTFDEAILIGLASLDSEPDTAV